MAQKLHINLLHPSLLPTKEKLSLNRVVLVLTLLLVLMLFWAYYSSERLRTLEWQVNNLSLEKARKDEKLDELKKQYSVLKQDTALIAQLQTLKMVMKNKQALNQKLTDPTRTYATGYAKSMTELSQHHHASISLQEVMIEQDELVFSGLAKSPEAVPQWLAGFEHSTWLSGKHFKNFRLVENKNNITAFTIGSTFIEKNSSSHTGSNNH